jgi:hypothetical protein
MTVFSSELKRSKIELKLFFGGIIWYGGVRVVIKTMFESTLFEYHSF